MTEQLKPETQTVWAPRPIVLSLFLGLCALGVYLALDNLNPERLGSQPGRQAIAALLFFGGLAFAVSLEPVRAVWSALFALIAGVTIAGITYWVSGYSGRGFEWNWSFGSGVLALVLATPLFQAARDEGGWQFPYSRTHFHVWTDAVIVGLAALFTGLAFLLLLLLGGLFDLIGIKFISKLIEQGWFSASFAGVSFGAALGIARNNSVILGSVQKVLLIVLSILALPLAIGLAVFLLLLLVTGLDTLWDSTKATTPIVLGCAIGAFILVNAVIRNADDPSESRLLNGSALVLSLCILPLAIIAAISMGLRVDQHGFTPDRLWGLTAVIIAAGFGLGYLVAIVRRRADWQEALRSANTHLAMAVCAATLFLALPIMDFGAMSTRNQLARLQTGVIEPEAFDWAALRFDYGPSGRAAVQRLAKSRDPALARPARLALKASDRYALINLDGSMAGLTPEREKLRQERSRLSANMRMVPEDARLRARLLQQTEAISWCEMDCVVVRLPSGSVKILAKRSGTLIEVFDWTNGLNPAGYFSANDVALGKASRIEVRKTEAYQIVVDGKPLPELFPEDQ